MKTKKIIIMNGRWFNHNKSQHIYIGAHSIADACRICEQISGRKRGWRREINVYFAKGCWGNSMNGIEPERGAWIQTGQENPIRVL
jgi:hypothetical protein